MGFEKNAVLWAIRRSIDKTVKEKRLVFNGEDKISYTNKEGLASELSFDGMVDVFIQAAYGGARGLMSAGVSDDDIKGLIAEEYKKQKGGK